MTPSETVPDPEAASAGAGGVAAQAGRALL
jgi:hypothetical protein